MHYLSRFIFFFVLISQTTRVMPSPNYLLIQNVEYSNPEGQHLLLDLYLPDRQAQKGLVLWIHGGLWSRGSKENVRLLSLTQEGYAISSINYRLSGMSPYPAQVEDAKAAIRWLINHKNDYHLNTQKIIIAGESAGGHLAALAGLTTLNDQSQPLANGIIVYYGASNLNSILKQSTHSSYELRKNALDMLFGGPIENKKAALHEASPIHYVSHNSPPLLIFHGVQDIQMPINQAHELVEAYKAKKGKVKFYVLNHAGHADKQFYHLSNMQRVNAFINDL